MLNQQMLQWVGTVAAVVSLVACNQGGGNERKSGNTVQPTPSTSNSTSTPAPQPNPPSTQPVVTNTTPTSTMTMPQLINYLRLYTAAGKLMLRQQLKEKDPVKFELYDKALDFSLDNTIAFLNGKDPKESSKAMIDYVKARQTEFKIKDADMPKIEQSSETFFVGLAGQRDSGALLKMSPMELGMMFVGAIPPEVLAELGADFDLEALRTLFGAVPTP